MRSCRWLPQKWTYFCKVHCAKWNYWLGERVCRVLLEVEGGAGKGFLRWDQGDTAWGLVHIWWVVPFFFFFLTFLNIGLTGLVQFKWVMIDLTHSFHQENSFLIGFPTTLSLRKFLVLVSLLYPADEVPESGMSEMGCITLLQLFSVSHCFYLQDCHDYLDCTNHPTFYLWSRIPATPSRGIA